MQLLSTCMQYTVSYRPGTSKLSMLYASVRQQNVSELSCVNRLQQWPHQYTYSELPEDVDRGWH